jgi:hypothetical protein
MPCYQASNLPPGFATSGSAGYKTEAECLAACNCCPILTASGIEVTVSGVNHVSRYKQAMNWNFFTDAVCCIMAGDNLLTSYVFAGQNASGTFSLTKAASNVTLPVFGLIPAGAWYYSFSNDDIVFAITLTTTTSCVATLTLMATSWAAYHYEINENPRAGGCPPFTFFVWRCPTSAAGRHYGLGEKNTVAGNSVAMSCNLANCSDALARGCFQTTTGAGDRFAINQSWTLTDYPKTGNAYNVNLVAKYKPSLISHRFCREPEIPPVFVGGDSSPDAGSDVITISRVVLT